MPLEHQTKDEQLSYFHRGHSIVYEAAGDFENWSVYDRRIVDLLSDADDAIKRLTAERDQYKQIAEINAETIKEMHANRSADDDALHSLTRYIP